jgi:hypothetical protein
MIRGFCLNIFNKEISLRDNHFMCATLVSPGISVTITDESMYVSAGQTTIPLIVFATASNKASPTAGGGIAPYTVPAQANQLYLATSQRDLIQNFGNPIFYSSQGTPLHGYELNEFGLWAAYSYLGISNQAYVLRANLDLGSLLPSASAPIGLPVAGTYWLDLGNTIWGVFRSNGNASPGAAWTLVTVLTALTANVDVNNVPLTSFGTTGNVCVVPTTASNYIYENIGGTWYKIGSTQWEAQHTTVLTGTATAPTLIQNNSLVINGTTVTISQATPTLANLVSDITTANITGIVATIAVSGALTLTNTAGGSIILANGTGTPLAALGLTVGTTSGVSVTRNNNATYPSGLVAGSFWIKGNPANNGASWAVKYYNSSIAAFTLLSAPFYQFNSTLLDGNVTKDAAAIAAMVSPTSGNVYIGFDVTTGDQQIRRWSGSQWQSLVYEADFTGPQTAPPAGTYWFNSNFQVDIMYGNGLNWLGYRHNFPGTDINGPQIDGSAPTVQSNGITALAEGDLWIDGSNLENYPVISRWDIPTLSWITVSNTDHTSPYGIVFADARQDSGPTFTGIGNPAAYNYSSTAPADLAMSDYVDPDAPDPRTFPAGTLLFNTRYSSSNVKAWTPTYFRAGGLSPSTDYTLSPYTVGSPVFTFPPLANGGRWVTASGNKTDGSPYMGRKAQRAMVVTAISASVAANQEIRSEIVFFNLMAAPGYPELIPDFISLNVDMKQVSFCVADTPARLASDGTSIQNWATNAADAAITGEDGLTVSDDYTGVYYPWGLGTNLDGTEIMIPPSAVALVTIAYNDQVAYPWYAPAGFNRGLVTNATSVGYLDATTSEYVPVILNQGQRDVLYTNNINPIAYIPNRGLVVYGQKTLDPTATALDRINVARLVNYVAYNLDTILKPFLFEPNTATVRATAASTCERFFTQLISLNGLYDFAVVCDATNNTPAEVDANELWVDCAIQPTKAIEFIYVPVRILTTQATV